MKNRLIVLLVIVVSGNPALNGLSREVVYLVPAGLLALYAILRRAPITRRDLLFLAAFSCLSAVHLITFGGEVVTASVGFLARLVLALLAVRLVTDFHEHYTAAMSGLALLSFVFFVPVLAGLDLASALAPFRIPIPGSDMVHIGLHNFHLPEVAKRNCGMFGEPGMFAGYLILALLLTVGERGRKRNRKIIVLTLALLTTQSTTGYIALVFVFIIFALARRLAETGRLGYLTAVPAVAVVCIAGGLAYETLPFMKAKVVDQYAQMASAAEGANINRIGNLMFDLDYIQRRPAAGWSPRLTTRSTIDADILELASGQGNGLSGFAVKFGVVGLLVYCCAVYGLFRRRYGSIGLAAMAVLVVAVVLTGEQFLDGPLFLSLMFLPNPSSDGRSSSGAIAVE